MKSQEVHAREDLVETMIVVMPAYNEAEGIVDFISEMNDAFVQLGMAIHFHVQNDMSTDLTLAKLSELSLQPSINLTVHTNEHNMGHGPTSRAALSFGADTNADYVLHLDGDGQFTVTDILRVIQHGLVSEVPTVGKRITRSDPYYRKILTRSLRIWVSVIARTFAIEDANSPLRFQSVKSLQETLARIPVDALIPSIWWSVITGKQVIQYVPVTSIDRRGNSAQGTMWGRNNRFRGLVPPRRLISFSYNSFVESLKIAKNAT
jgi:glycosyltransferase involved in cell wall biosynthesis